jgi:hypothetical protein
LFIINPHGAASQKTAFFIVTAMEASNPAQKKNKARTRF